MKWWLIVSHVSRIHRDPFEHQPIFFRVSLVFQALEAQETQKIDHPNHCFVVSPAKPKKQWSQWTEGSSSLIHSWILIHFWMENHQFRWIVLPSDIALGSIHPTRYIAALLCLKHHENRIFSARKIPFFTRIHHWCWYNNHSPFPSHHHSWYVHHPFPVMGGLWWTLYYWYTQLSWFIIVMVDDYW